MRMDSIPLTIGDPGVAAEWDYEKNDFTPESISTHSNKYVWWICSKGHSWRTTVNARTGLSHSGCPYCSNNKVLKGYNDFESIHPELLIEWDYEKNGDLRPDCIFYNSTKKVWWRCVSCGYEWESAVANRHKGHKCPACQHHALKTGYNDLGRLYPEIAKQWDYEKNTTCPEDYMAHSNKRVWWICSKGHSWNGSINGRTSKGTGCPICSNQMLLKGYNDLLTLRPDVAKEWNYIKNQNKPEDYFAQSNQKVWWTCSVCGYEWEAKISNRTSKNATGCRACNSTYQVSESETIIFHYLHSEFPDAIQTYRPKWLDKKEIDIYVPSLKLAIEYDGEVWHKDINKDKEKTRVIKAHGINLIRFREERLPKLKDGSLEILVSSKRYDFARLNQPLKDLFTYINKEYNLDVEVDVDAQRDWKEVLGTLKTSRGRRSLRIANPKVASQWDYDRNYPLTPEDVLVSSNKVVWWICEKGHRWESSISNRRNRGCPYCGNKILLTGFNDLETVKPDFAKEWDYHKNKMKPNEIIYSSHQKVWWKCNCCGHEWEVSPGSRAWFDSQCPKCHYKDKVIEGQMTLLDELIIK